MNEMSMDTAIELKPGVGKITLPNFGRRAEDAVVFSAGSTEQPRNRIVVIIPAYNEERFIGSVVLKVRRYAGTVIVVDDGSKDGTADVAAATGVVVVKHTHNSGKGAALNTGFRVARQHNPEVVVMLDADGQHLPEEMDAVVKPVLEGKADIVVGSRYIEHTCDVPIHRLWGHKAFNLLTEAASGVRATDSQSGYRAFSPAALEKINFHSRGFSVESEMQFIAHELGLRLLEVPVTIRYLDRPKRSVWKQGLIVLNGVLKLTGQYRPMIFFGFPGSLLILAGFAWGAWVLERFEHTRELAIGNALICFLLLIVGLMLSFTGFTLHSVRGLLVDILENHKLG